MLQQHTSEEVNNMVNAKCCIVFSFCFFETLYIVTHFHVSKSSSSRNLSMSNSSKSSIESSVTLVDP